MYEISLCQKFRAVTGKYVFTQPLCLGQDVTQVQFLSGEIFKKIIY